MIKKKLKNGLTVIHYPTRDPSIAVNVLVKAGSNNETARNYGVSHFIEHMLFEGTKTRTALDITREIEGLGGEINAYTSSERTCYSIKALKRHIERSVEVLSDIILNPSFDKDKIEKERSIILSEVLMRKDQPRSYQWDLFMKAVFKGHPTSLPIIGKTSTVKSMRREDLLAYYRRFYTADNTIISVVGDIKDPFRLIGKYFGSMGQGKGTKAIKPAGFLDSIKRASSRQKTQQVYSVIGYPTAVFSDDDSDVLEVMRAILGKGMSGRLFDEIRNKRGLGYDVGCHHEAGNTAGFIACYVSAEADKIKECDDIMRKELHKVSEIGERELTEAKNYLEGEFMFDLEGNDKLADSLCIWEHAGALNKFKGCVKRIQRITEQDIRRVSRKYINGNYAKAVIRP